nr:hypothetical protein [Tanacetum cinerariifolium]
MREGGCASWDRGNGTWGGRERSFGTVPVLAEIVLRLWNFDKLGFNGKRTWGGRGVIWKGSGGLQVYESSCGRRVNSTRLLAGNLVGGYCVEIVLRLWNLDKLGFNVRLFDENLLPDPAFLCRF